MSKHEPMSRKELPLSWSQARSTLRKLLVDFLETDPKPTEAGTRQPTHDQDSTSSSSLTFIRTYWLQYDLDLYVGALGSAIALLVISARPLWQQTEELPFSELTPTKRFHRSHLSATVLILFGCILNMWLIRRRKFAETQGSEDLKRQEISHFLKDMENMEKHDREQAQDVDTVDPTETRTETEDSGMLDTGSSLSDIYPVFRLTSSRTRSGTGTTGSWTRVPTLLLVKGDHVALQIGDIAPAPCRLVDNETDTIDVLAGERVTLPMIKEKTSSTRLPRGRTTLPKDSSVMLGLCNRMNVFVLLNSPMTEFLSIPQVKSKVSQVVRQLEAVRVFLSLFGFATFVIAGATLLARFDRDEFSSNFLSAPFLVLIAVSPLTAPSCLIMIEALGTARILASYHPFASLRQDSVAPVTTNIDLLLIRYFFATIITRLSLRKAIENMRYVVCFGCRLVGLRSDEKSRAALVPVPPSSLKLVEKLGVATAFTLVDDELVCEPHAIPQQLLVPSGKGLKLLDICPAYDDDSDDSECCKDETARQSSRRSLDGGEMHDSDSDSDDRMEYHHIPTRQKRRRLLKKAKENIEGKNDDNSTASLDHEVQFEDPQWWQHLPSLKCIGLACLLIEEKDDKFRKGDQELSELTCKDLLSRLISNERRCTQLRSLAQCIGFLHKATGTEERLRGDISPFDEKLRLFVVDALRIKERLAIDSHERGSEDSRWWGLLRPDSTSVVVQDRRSGAYQLLTVGDPRPVTRMCRDAWQGESSTILPLGTQDKATIMETSENWRLSDLDVQAFSYAPIPHSFEQMYSEPTSAKHVYLLDNEAKTESISKDKNASDDWHLLQNQIFLGLLGSPVIPRQETQGLLGALQDAGVRFVYFSPRNMRLTKEIAAQMGIDVAWNCAISLRALDQGQEDPHRMISTYADWDVNAKLPHGVENVKRHLAEVDNVPLLVSLFTDVTKTTTREMIEVFQAHHDTVIAVGLSHLPWNTRLFISADLAVGIDVLADGWSWSKNRKSDTCPLLQSEVSFVSAISAHACAFRLRGVETIEYMPSIIAQGRASLQAATCAYIYLIHGCVSFGLYTCFSVFSVATAVLPVSPISAVLVLQAVLPIMCLTMTMSDMAKKEMLRVPPKNDPEVTFGKKEGLGLCVVTLLKAIMPAILPQLLFLIAFGEGMVRLESDLLVASCGGRTTRIGALRCQALSQYSGPVRETAGVFAFTGYVLCLLTVSASFMHRRLPLLDEPPWKRNKIWAFFTCCIFSFTVLYALLFNDAKMVRNLPWYFYLLWLASPFLCLIWDEILKRKDRALLDRAEKLRRLQFETRLGMWSPR